MMLVSNSLRSTAGSLEGILCVHVDDKICGGSGPSFSEALLNLPKCVQNKATKEIMITQTEFAAKIVKIPHVCCEKEDERRSC